MYDPPFVIAILANPSPVEVTIPVAPTFSLTLNVDCVSAFLSNAIDTALLDSLRPKASLGLRGAHTLTILPGPSPPFDGGQPVVISGAGENITLGGFIIE